MKCRAYVFLIALLAFTALCRADLKADMQSASVAIGPALNEAGKLIEQGLGDEANNRLLAIFPEKTRTTAQALILANVIYRQDAKISYALHKQVAAELPDEADVQIEWAMEQHRAGEYPAAIESYAKYIKANPTFGPALGMQAECLLRSGMVREAAIVWAKSEKGSGSLETLESWVCEVHTHTFPDQDRAAYLRKARTGDIESAEKLIALDSDFSRDWWNAGPRVEFLQNDLPILRRVKFADQQRFAALQCAGECAIIQGKVEGDAGKVLKKWGYLIDEKHTLPQCAELIQPMLVAALSSKAISKDEAHDMLAAPILARAMKSHEVAMFNMAGYLTKDLAKMAEIDQAAWDATSNERFAAALMVNLEAQQKLAVDDPRLAIAAQQFPENALIAHVVYDLTVAAGKPTHDALVSAIKAEYSHLSSAGNINGRPSARMLRTYFAALSNDLKL